MKCTEFRLNISLNVNQRNFGQLFSRPQTFIENSSSITSSKLSLTPRTLMRCLLLFRLSLLPIFHLSCWDCWRSWSFIMPSLVSTRSSKTCSSLPPSKANAPKSSTTSADSITSMDLKSLNTPSKTTTECTRRPLPSTESSTYMLRLLMSSSTRLAVWLELTSSPRRWP